MPKRKPQTNWAGDEQVMAGALELRRQWRSAGVPDSRVQFLESLVVMREAAQDMIDRNVRVLLDAGAGFAEVAVALGTTRQAAWARYGPEG